VNKELIDWKGAVEQTSKINQVDKYLKSKRKNNNFSLFIFIFWGFKIYITLILEGRKH
jgi:hypothetical protein